MRYFLAGVIGVIGMAVFVIVLISALNAIPTREGCARKLGIHYTIEDGATEQLDAFARCLSR